jgi:hypothetical protein
MGYQFDNGIYFVEQNARLLSWCFHTVIGTDADLRQILMQEVKHTNIETNLGVIHNMQSARLHRARERK